MNDKIILLSGCARTIAGEFAGFTDKELATAILALEAVSANVSRLVKAAKEETLHRSRTALAEAYKAKGSQFGVVHIELGRHDAEINVPQRVEWDQEQLAKLEREIREDWKADAGEYIDSKLSVKESRYKAWPSELKARFEPARIVKAGSPSVTITVKE